MLYFMTADRSIASLDPKGLIPKAWIPKSIGRKINMKRAMRNQLLKLVKAVQPDAGAQVSVVESDTRCCLRCGTWMPGKAKFCAECGEQQG